MDIKKHCFEVAERGSYTVAGPEQYRTGGEILVFIKKWQKKLKEIEGIIKDEMTTFRLNNDVPKCEGVSLKKRVKVEITGEVPKKYLMKVIDGSYLEDIEAMFPDAITTTIDLKAVEKLAKSLGVEEFNSLFTWAVASEEDSMAVRG